MNKVFLIGRLVASPKLNNTLEKKLCTFSIAVNRNANEPDYFNIVVWEKGQMAQNCYKYLQKGSRVCVTGYLKINTYMKDGIKKFVIEVIADDVTFLSPKKAKENAAQ